MNEQNNETKQTTETCGPGCSCGTTGVGSRTKWMICGVVGLAAVVVVAAHVSRTRVAESQAKPQEYAAVVPVVAAVEAAKPLADAGGWGAPLKSMADLNQVATNTDAVFVVLPSSDGDRTMAIQQEVSAAASTITARETRMGTVVKMGTFLLSKDSQEYASLSQQVGVPAVLALYKGRGMAVVPDQQVTQDNLLKAFVGASRPSSCGPSGCGPSAPACN